MSLFDITGEDIQKLNDSDLRELIGRLCEAELQAEGLSSSYATWDGKQTAKDGGVDVRVAVPHVLPKQGYILMAHTVFQVKTTDYTPSRISGEMCLKGELRPSIVDVASKDGAYIIVSGQASVSDSALDERKAAMQKTLARFPGNEHLTVDYYGSGQIASWVREHPTVIIWVREKIGRPLQGWKPYGNWSNSPEGVENEYLPDDKLKLIDMHHTDGMSVPEGINMIRDRLRNGGTSIRLVGLSGVGKTRLLEALFDEKVGEKPLLKASVVYTDSSHSPSPSPLEIAEQLYQKKGDAYLFIDNCSSKLHRDLTDVCVREDSRLSLITVEYDVQEDQPQQTEVIKLEPSSSELICKLIKRRYWEISDLDVDTIASLAEGNARLAIALAATMKPGETLGKLADRQLFERLFWQRQEKGEHLRQAAEVCSLVYSFNGSDEDKQEMELLASIADLSYDDIYQSVAKLKRRDLVQSRGQWRAVLPPAIANWLAGRALENRNCRKLASAFEGAPARLLKSFSRRLKYLDGHEGAMSIAKSWLSDGGLLADLVHLDDDGIDMLTNISIILPEEVLGAIEKKGAAELLGQNYRLRDGIIWIIDAIAFYKCYFARCARLLCSFAKYEDAGSRTNLAKDRLLGFFPLFLSGTQATPVTRLGIIRELVESEDSESRELGIALLGKTLQAGDFTTIEFSRDFGLRSRDFGYNPREDPGGESAWYYLFIDYAVTVARTNESAKQMLANALPPLFSTGWYDEAEDAVHKILEAGPWPEVWKEFRRLLEIKRNKLKNVQEGQDSEREENLCELVARLEQLDDRLAPTTFEQEVRLLCNMHEWDGAVSFMGFNSTQHEEIRQAVVEYGKKLAVHSSFPDLRKDLLTGQGSLLYHIGHGLGFASKSPREIWGQLRDACQGIDGRWNTILLRGFLGGLAERDDSLCNGLLDKAVDDEVFGPRFPELQSYLVLDVKGIDRLIRSVQLGRATISSYSFIALGRNTNENIDSKLCDLFREVASKEGGIQVIVESLHDLISFAEYDSIYASMFDQLRKLTTEMLERVDYAKESRDLVPKLSKLYAACFHEGECKGKAIPIILKLRDAMAKHFGYAYTFQDLLHEIARCTPREFLEVFISEKAADIKGFRNVVNNTGGFKIDEEVAIAWCEEDPGDRYEKLARLIVPFEGLEKGLSWKPFAFRILDSAPNPLEIAETFVDSLYYIQGAFWGSLSSVLERRKVLFEALKCNRSKEFIHAIDELESKYSDYIVCSRNSERTRENNRNGFEE